MFWESHEDFGTIGQVLMPILLGMGTDPGQPEVMPVLNSIPG
jgi:hypothetical protein